jgi:hypothetical protein
VRCAFLFRTDMRAIQRSRALTIVQNQTQGTLWGRIIRSHITIAAAINRDWPPGQPGRFWRLPENRAPWISFPTTYFDSLRLLRRTRLA